MMIRAVALVLVTFGFVAGTQAQSIRLEHEQTVYDIDPASGRLMGGRQGDQAFIEPSEDRYTLFLANSDVNRRADESKDRVQKTDLSTDGRRATLVCINDELNVTIQKTYRIEEDTGFLFKRIDVTAGEGVAGYLAVESGLAVPSDWWRQGILWQPVYHSWGPPFTRTSAIRDVADLAPTNAAQSVFTLYSPKKQATLIHFRWGEDEFAFCEGFLLPPYADRCGKLVRPRQWLMGVSYDFIGGDSRRKMVVQFVYGVMGESRCGFYQHYTARDEYYELILAPLERMPPWVHDTIISDDMDLLHRLSNFSPQRFADLLKSVLEKKIFFGYVQAQLWGAFPHEYYMAKPEDVEDGSGENPVETARLVALLKDASPRLKVALYTHYGSPTACYRSGLARTAEKEGWLSYNRDGTVIKHATDYNSDPGAAVSLTPAAGGYRQFLKQRFAEFFDHMHVDFMYMDTAPVDGWYALSWQPPYRASLRTKQSLYREFLDIAINKGGTVFMNHPVPIGNSHGYSEFPWYDYYKSNWRRVSGLLAVDQAMNPPGRRLYLAAQPALVRVGSPAEEGVRIYLNMMTMFNLGYSLLDTYRFECKERFYREAPPYLQAAYELRQRGLADADVEPDFWAADGDVEAHAWAMQDGYGLITAMNHQSQGVEKAVRFDTKPLGLRPGRPALIWRLEMADPREVDFDGVTMDSPVRRLADQRLLAMEVELPARLGVNVNLPAENPVAVAVTHSPAIITSVDGKPCQYWLPAAYGVTATGAIDPAARRLTVAVHNPREHATLRIFVPEGNRDELSVVQRGRVHPAGVAVGAESIDYRVVEVGGNRFVELGLKTGDREILVQY